MIVVCMQLNLNNGQVRDFRIDLDPGNDFTKEDRGILIRAKIKCFLDEGIMLVDEVFRSTEISSIRERIGVNYG